jgi:S-formylglutathione hydrolase
VPVLLYLAGLTCNEETFAIKAGAQRVAAQLGLMLVTPDTSPRGTGVEGADAAWDFGTAAGFYLDATQAPWAHHWRMESYITGELPAVLAQHFPVQEDQGLAMGVFGHSMGGHGALTLALRHPGLFRSVSALAPIAAPMRCPWGVKAFTGYLGGSTEDRKAWAAHDATALIESGARCPPLLIDQGEADKFLAEQLLPHRFEAACRDAGQPLRLRRHAGYDHGYFFISSFVEDHLRHHALALKS